MTDNKLKIRRQAFSLTICTVVFTAVYNFTTIYASSLDYVPSFTFYFERFIPFVPLSIIPYMMSGIFFCAVFFCCKSENQLRILTWRMLFVTITAGIFFIAVPLRFSLEKPDVSNDFLNLPFLLLKAVDAPFNQSPSLHIVFAFIFWSVFRELSKWRIPLLITLILVGISTLTTYQHHFIDVLTGAILAHISFILIPDHKKSLKNHNFRTANYCFLSSLIFILATLLLSEYIGVEGFLLFLPAVVLALFGYCYKKNNRLPLLSFTLSKQDISQAKKS